MSDIESEWVEKVLCLSTEHLDPSVMDDGDLLAGALDGFRHRVTPHSHGWIVHLVMVDDEELESSNKESWFRPIHLLARELGCAHVYFDDVEMVHPDLVVFDPSGSVPSPEVLR